MTFDQFDQFESYTDNTLPAPQRRTLQQQLDNDATLKAELDDYQQLRHSIEAVKLKQQLERLHARLDRQGVLNAPHARPARRLSSRWVATFAIVLVLAGLGVYFATRPTHAERIFLAYYQPEPVARDLNTCGTELLPGLQAYRTGQFGQALALFRQLSHTQPCVSYYTGLTQLALDNGPAAITALEAAAAPNTPTGLTHQKADWYLALAYLKANRSHEARHRLIAIAGQAGHPFRGVAQKALADLRNQ